jgi:hypothetical protein
VCRGCALGKNAKVAFPSNKSKPKGILDLIHSDVSGSMLVVLLPLYTPQVAWKKPSIHWVCPWGQVSSQGAIT